MRHPVVFPLVFSDVDGTLLDHRTYSFAPARQALERLAETGVPLILCSSKTRAELETLQQELAIAHPFICENGGALCVPRGYFPFEVRGARPVGRHDVIEFGLPYPEVVSRLRAAASALGLEVTGFADLDDEQVARLCELPASRARLARQREYDEAFVVGGPDAASDRQRLFRALEACQLCCTSGGRFDHVAGPTDKGHGVAVLRMLYERAPHRRIVTIGLGDSLNDLPMLAAVDIPVVVRNPSSRDQAALERDLRGHRVTSGVGPTGWNEAVGEILQALVPEPGAPGERDRGLVVAHAGSTVR